jgi:ATP-dependent DNA ligase
MSGMLPLLPIGASQGAPAGGGWARRALVFAHACKLGLEGIVSKRRDFPYRSGRTKFWIKINNPHSQAMPRVGASRPSWE